MEVGEIGGDLKGMNERSKSIDNKHKKKVILLWSIIGVFAFILFGLATTTITENTIYTSGNGSFIDSLGIGTQTPTQKLDVRGSANLSGILYYNNDTAITLLNNTLLIWSVNTTGNIGNLYNYTASLIANLSAGQYQAITNSTISSYNLSMFNYVGAVNLSNFNYVNSVASSLNTSANIWNLIDGFFTNVAWLNQTGIFAENINFSKNITLDGGSINLNNNATITREDSLTSIFIDENGNLDITLG